MYNAYLIDQLRNSHNCEHSYKFKQPNHILCMGHLISSNKYILIGCHAKIAGENVDWCISMVCYETVRGYCSQTHAEGGISYWSVCIIYSISDQEMNRTDQYQDKFIPPHIYVYRELGAINVLYISKEHVCAFHSRWCACEYSYKFKQI